MDGLGVLALLALFGAAALMIAPPAPGGWRARRHLLLCGVLLLLLDLSVELVGTAAGMWSYNRSILFLVGRVPVELLGLFGGGGVLLAAVHLQLGRLGRAPSMARVLPALTAFGLLLYLWTVVVAGESMTLLVVAVPLGLWGLSAIREEVHRSQALLLAAFVALLDHGAETWIVGTGSYDYAGGFGVETPLTYALLTLAVFGWLDGRRRRVLARAAG